MRWRDLPAAFIAEWRQATAEMHEAKARAEAAKARYYAAVKLREEGNR